MKEHCMLVADIGGTFSRFALFRLKRASVGLTLALMPESRIKLETQAFKSFAELLAQLRTSVSPGGYTLLPSASRQAFQPSAAGMAVPGPVENGRCIAPNIPWPLEVKEAESALGIPAALINDFAAQGRACLFPEILGLHVLLPGKSRPDAPQVILGAGTGLGKAQILPHPASCTNPARRILPKLRQDAALSILIPEEALTPQGLAALNGRVMPSEGGHALFPFCGEHEAAYAAFARNLSGRHEIIGDMTVSGYGLAMLHAFHNKLATLPSLPEINPLLEQSPAALEWFARFYGRACRNFVLETLGLGGVYLSGGMLSHVPGLRGHPAFEAEFRRSETQGHLLEEVPVQWVSNQDAGLWGAALYGIGPIFTNRHGAL